MGQPGTDRFSVGVNGNEFFDSRAQEADEVALADGVTGRVDQPGPDRVTCESTAAMPARRARVSSLASSARGR